MIVVDLSGRVLLWNPAAEQLFGWSAAEALGAFAPHVPPEQHAEFHTWVNGRWQMQPERRDVERLRKDGTRLRLRLLTTPVRDAQGRLWGILGMHNDLAEQALTEAELDRQRHLLQTIIDNIPVMIAFFDADGRFVLVNRAWERLLGWDVPAMNAQPDILTLFYPDPDYRQAALAYMQSGTAEWRRFTTTTRSGTPIEALWANVRLPDGTSIGIGQDVTALQHQTEALQYQLDLMHLLLESIPFGYFYAEAPSGKILHSNSQVERIVGHPLEPVDTMDAYTVFHAYHSDGTPLAAAEYPIARVLQTGAPVLDQEMRYLRGDSRWITLRGSALPVRNAQGTMLGVINLFEDITERLQLEERFLQAQKMESIGRLAGGIAHDFNNLLVPIIGYVDLGLHSLTPDSKLFADLQQVRLAAERAADLTRQILAFSRRQMLEIRAVDVNTIVQSFSAMIGRLIGEDVLLQTRLTPDLPMIRADKVQIEQVLLNLVVNARDAMPNGGRLVIETALVYLNEPYIATYTDDLPHGPYIMLAVGDSGHGMDAATRKLIFEPFFTTKPVGQGTGLGLATVFGIIKQHQGFIWAHSEPGRGALFKIYLPVEHSADLAPTPQPEPHMPADEAPLLVAVAEPMLRHVVVETLHACGYSSLPAASGAEALQYATTQSIPIRLLITTPHLPDHTGRDIHHHLVAAHGVLPALYLNPDAPMPSPLAHEPAAPHLYLSHPFAVTDLIQAVRSLLASRR